MHRLLLSFSSVLDSVAAMLLERASTIDLRGEQMMFLDARGAVLAQRANLLAEFEKNLRQRVNERISGRGQAKADFSKVDATNLTLIDTTAMDESVLTGNIARVVENLCFDELQLLNRGMGQLLGDPDLATTANPLAPSSIVESFAQALNTMQTGERAKFAILKELNQAALGEINEIYADLNQHLVRMHVVLGRPIALNRGAGAGKSRGKSASPPPGATGAPAASAEVDIMSLFKRMFGAPGTPPPMSSAGFNAGGPGGAGAEPAAGASRYIPHGPLAPTPSGYVPGAPIMVTPVLGEGLARLQHGETGFDLGGGTLVQFSGVPDSQHNVLRDLQGSSLGRRVNQLESMTIELVAMLFDYIFETKDLPDGIKALLARLQIPVLKAAMLDSAFFAKKSHPSRRLVNELAHAGLGWATDMGPGDPLYRKLDEIVHRILDGFADDLTIFEEMRETLHQYLAEEEKAAELNIQNSAEAVNERDRRELAAAVVRVEIERRIERHALPNFLAGFLRGHWSRILEATYFKDGEESEAWAQGLSTLDDLVWSVQPKKGAEDRKHLIALLPSLLKRLMAGMRLVPWAPEERERFMSNLVEAHAAAVKPSLVAASSPTTAVAEQAKADAEQAKSIGDEAAAAKAEQLAEAMAPAEPIMVEVPEIIEDYFLEIAQSLDRGVWVEFEEEDGQLSFAKLAWVSPLRGTYLFTNRQGQKATSMTAEELAQRFRNDRARLVEAEPLIDRAFSSVMASIGDKYPEPAAA